VDKDEANRPDTTLEGLARLKPAFRPDGTITASNAPGVNTAAAAVVVANADWAIERGLITTARLVSWGIAAVEPGMFGLGPIPAVKQALERAGWDIGSIERVEINEAFAAIAIVVARELGLPDGGSTGAGLAVTPNRLKVSFGWGTWIRTKIDGVRVRCSTVELSPTRWKAKFGRMDVSEARKLKTLKLKTLKTENAISRSNWANDNSMLSVRRLMRTSGPRARVPCPGPPHPYLAALAHWRAYWP
jgi:hypothetical protein